MNFKNFGENAGKLLRSHALSLPWSDGMFPFVLLLWSSLAYENHVENAARFMTSGNYLMAEAELLQADPQNDPVRLGQMLAELAIRMRSVPSKQKFIRENLQGRYSWKSVADLALAGLAAHQQDWASFERNAKAIFQDNAFVGDPIRFRLLFHLARHTPVTLQSLSISQAESTWANDCRNLEPNQTLPKTTGENLPFFLRQGHYLENRASFSPPQLPAAASENDRFVAAMIQTRQFLNANDLGGAAQTINRMMAMNTKQAPAYLKIPFYSLMLEYFQRKGQIENVGKTAENLNVVRNLAFLPLQAWPERVKAVKTQLQTPLPAESSGSELPDSITQIETQKPEVLVLSEPIQETTPKAEPVPQTTPTPATEIQPEPVPQTTPTPATVVQAEPVVQSTLEKAEEAVETVKDTAIPATSELESTLAPELTASPVETTDPASTISDLEPVKETVSEVAQPELPETSSPSLDTTTPLVKAEPANPDPNLALARALLADGDTLMAEAQFMAVNPRRQDVLSLGVDLAGLALRTNSVSSKTAFFRDYLPRQDAWRGVALVALSVFSATQQDWQSYEKYVRDLFREFAPFQEPAKYRFIYYAARYTPARIPNLRPQEALWFQKARGLKSFALWPACPEAGLPYRYQHAQFMDWETTFEIPATPADADDNDRYFAGLLQIRNALNGEDLNAAATYINGQRSLQTNAIDYQWRSLFQELSLAYFEKRGEMEKAEVAKRNANLYQGWTVLPFQAFSARASKVAEMVTLVESEGSVATIDQPLVESVPKPDEPTPTISAPVDPNSTWVELERAVRKGSRNLELTIRGKETRTTYERIYKAYLLGTIYLNRGRYQSAYERLSLAEGLVRDLPFPALESKVMLAMADYYMAERNEQQANWYRIAAIQLWNQSTNLPQFAIQDKETRRTPFPEIMDENLRKAVQKSAIHTLIYHNELAALLALREQAYLRNALSDNGAISQQLNQIGQQLAGMVTQIATEENPDVTPRKFNDTQKLWSGLWQSVYPYYQGESVPGLQEIQARLSDDQRILVFLEGSTYFGLLVISQNQGFAVGLGSKNNFFGLDTPAQFDFLEGRLGPVWTNPGGLVIQLSKSFRNPELLTQLRGRMFEPQRLRLISSLKSFVASKPNEACEGILVVNGSRGEARSWADTLPGPQTRMELTDDRSTFLQNLEQHRHVVLSGTFSTNEAGLTYDAFQFKLHELPRFQPELCSLTLIAPLGPNLLEALDELALVQIRSAPAIQVRPTAPNTATSLPDVHLNEPFENAPLEVEKPQP